MQRSGERVRTVGVRVVAVSAALAVGLGGCQAESSIVPAHSSDPVVDIETASFGEVEIVGHVYGNALTRAGSRVRVRPQSGTQEEVVHSLATGGSTFTIGFTGELLSRYDPSASETAPDEVYAAMMAALPEGVTAADPAPAEDRPVYVVSRNTSQSRGLTSMSSLRGSCGEFRLGARQEVLDDRALATAVGTAYDCSFASRTPIGPNPRQVLAALRSGDIGVGVVQSTDPILHPEDVVALKDDENAVRAQHLVPVFRKGSLTEDQLSLVNRISGELTTDDIRELLLGVEFGTSTPVDLANYWLDEHDY